MGGHPSRVLGACVSQRLRKKKKNVVMYETSVGVPQTENSQLQFYNELLTRVVTKCSLGSVQFSLLLRTHLAERLGMRSSNSPSNLAAARRTLFFNRVPASLIKSTITRLHSIHYLFFFFFASFQSTMGVSV